jgi:hypothetical protein
MWARHSRNFNPAPLFAALILSLIFPGFVSCSPYSGDDFYAGRPVSPEEISEIEAMIADGAEETAFRPETFADGSPKCYWTSGGTVWHIDPGCGRISSSSPLSCGTVEEAEADGKTRVCAVCGGKDAG